MVDYSPIYLEEGIDYFETDVFIDYWISCLYSGTLLNRHPSTADTHDITDNSESPNCPSYT